MPSLNGNTRRLLFCGVAFSVGASLIAYVVSKFLILTPVMRFSFTGWTLILAAVVLLVGCMIYAILGIGFGFRLSEILTENDGQVLWHFGFDTSLGSHQDRFVLLRNSGGLWIVRPQPDNARADRSQGK